MKVIADLQIHSRFSRATSSSLTLDNIEKYARLKGLNLLGTGDFTHPRWLAELKSGLREDGSGILASKSGFHFVLQGEISNIYTQDGKGRRVHTLLLARNFEIVDQINEVLLKKGRLDYDGRPIFGFNCIELVEMLRSISHDIEVIPAHIWTPWFSLFGSNSGFNSLEECYGDQTKHIHAIETGMSSNPAMNWRLSQLDKINIVSFSDSHSFWPWRLGREATILDIPLTYKAAIQALRTGDDLVETIEVDPNYGKYHYTGHRACSVCLSPQESQKVQNICPQCHKRLTVGVLERVEELADRTENDTALQQTNRTPFKTVLPLSEILAKMLGKGLATQTVWREYYTILKAGKNEFDVLLQTPQEELEKVTKKKIADAIIANRCGKVKVTPGYDGTYGELVLEELQEKTVKEKTQRGLGSFL